MSMSGLGLNRIAYCIPAKGWRRALRDIDRKLGCINDLDATRRVRLNISVTDEWVVLSGVQKLNWLHVLQTQNNGGGLT